MADMTEHKPEAQHASTPASAGGWFWWAGINEEEYNLSGACVTRKEALDRAYGNTEPGDTIFLIEARTDPDEDEDPETGLTQFAEMRNASSVIREEDPES